MLTLGSSLRTRSFTAATAPAASSVASGTAIRLSDVGAASTGSVWVSNGTSYFPYDGGQIVLARSSVQVTDAASGNDLIYAKVALPSIIMHANANIRVKVGFTCTSSVNTKTYRAHLSANSYAIGGTVVSGTIMAAMTGQSSVASHVFEAAISNRNSVSSQAGMFSGARNPGTISVGTATSAINTSSATTYLYLTALKATAGETMTMEFYTVEIC